MAQKFQFSTEIGEVAPKGEGLARRNNLSPNDLLARPADDIRVIADLVLSPARQWPEKQAVAWRETVNTVVEDKTITKMVDGNPVKETKKWTYFQLSAYRWWTYKEFSNKIAAVSSALIATGHSRETIFNIYSGTSAHWQLFAHGCSRQGITFATAYDSLGEEGLRHSINQPKVYGLFTNSTLLSTIANAVPTTPTLKVLIYDGKPDTVPAGALDKIKAAREDIKIYHLDDFLALGEEKPVADNLPKPEDVACIMYTSGSTGDPKGVLLTNANVIASVAGLRLMLRDTLDKGEHYFLAYLPLAHIFEFVVENSMFVIGIPLGYGTVKTLTDASVRNCYGDIREFRPTILIGVPAVWETIRKGIVAKVNAGGALKAKIFNGACSLKQYCGQNSYVAKILDKVVFAPIKQGTGGRLQWAVSGGSALSADTEQFINTALVPMIQGWGMTESTALSCIQFPECREYGVVGSPVPSVEIKLVDFDEAGYYSTNNPPQGEVWVRGNSICKGYFQGEELWKETFTEDGWLKTGDIGQWNADGTLSIIDRKKNLIKLAGGEYIALERLESVYKSCPVVANICVYGAPNANRPMAIIFPHEHNLLALAKEKGIEGDFGALCHDPAMNKAVLEALLAVGKKAKFKPLEMLQTVVLTAEEWTPQNGLLTAAQKLQRREITRHFKKEIDAVYP